MTSLFNNITRSYSADMRIKSSRNTAPSTISKQVLFVIKQMYIKYHLFMT